MSFSFGYLPWRAIKYMCLKCIFDLIVFFYLLVISGTKSAMLLHSCVQWSSGMKSWNAGHNSSNLFYRHLTVTSQSRDRFVFLKAFSILLYCFQVCLGMWESIWVHKRTLYASGYFLKKQSVPNFIKAFPIDFHMETIQHSSA